MSFYPTVYDHDEALRACDLLRNKPMTIENQRAYMVLNEVASSYAYNDKSGFTVQQFREAVAIALQKT